MGSASDSIRYGLGSVKATMSKSRNQAHAIPADSPAASSTATALSASALRRPPGDPRGDGDGRAEQILPERLRQTDDLERK